jgi:hypothetical protein
MKSYPQSYSQPYLDERLIQNGSHECTSGKTLIQNGSHECTSGKTLIQNGSHECTSGKTLIQNGSAHLWKIRSLYKKRIESFLLLLLFVFVFSG